LEPSDYSDSYPESYPGLMDDFPFDYFAANFRVSLGCLAAIEPISINPILPIYQSDIFTHTLSVELTNGNFQLSDGFAGQEHSLKAFPINEIFCN